jgi:hypothetical protein
MGNTASIKTRNGKTQINGDKKGKLCTVIAIFDLNIFDLDI